MRRFLGLVLILAAVSLGPALANTLKVGDRAPDVRLTGTDGHLHSLRDNVGKSWTVVCFYPKASTAG